MRGVLFEPTDDQRRLVRALSGFGVTHDDIARQVGCEPKTLRKHFRDELDRGSVEATAKVAQSLFQMATTGKNVAAAIFWMKCRGGWREKTQVEHTGLPRFVVSTGVPRAAAAEQLSDEQLERIAASGLPEDDDEEEEEALRARPGSYVIGERPPPDMTAEEWLERYGPRDLTPGDKSNGR
jgi:predicted transcriptional regulator